MPDLELLASDRSVVRSHLHASAAPIPLSGIPRALIAAGFTSGPIGYNRLYRLIVSGAVPAQQTMTNRWSVQSSDLPLVASALGLTPVVLAQPPEGCAPHAANSAA